MSDWSINRLISLIKSDCCALKINQVDKQYHKLISFLCRSHVLSFKWLNRSLHWNSASIRSPPIILNKSKLTFHKYQSTEPYLPPSQLHLNDSCDLLVVIFATSTIDRSLFTIILTRNYWYFYLLTSSPSNLFRFSIS